LLPGTNLRAELHDVLVYQEGDFFKAHRDAVKGSGHVATLSAVVAATPDCDGGDVVFPAGPDDEAADNKELCRAAAYLARWSRKAPGSWAAWFNSQLHEVQPLTHGRMVVVTYNLYLDGTAPLHELEVQGQHTTKTMAGLPIELVRNVAAFLDPESYCCLLRTNRAHRAVLGSAVGLAESTLSQHATFIQGCCRAVYAEWLVVPLKHAYCAEGRDTIEPDLLRGWDRMMFMALRRVFGPLMVVPTKMKWEVDENTQTPVNKYYSAYYAAHPMPADGPRTFGPHDCFEKIETEYDPPEEYDDGYEEYPTSNELGYVFGDSVVLPHIMHSPSPGGHPMLCRSRPLWGNMGVFQLYVTSNAAIVVDVASWV
jgi:hypothetical protein